MFFEFSFLEFLILLYSRPPKAINNDDRWRLFFFFSYGILGTCGRQERVRHHLELELEAGVKNLM